MPTPPPTKIGIAWTEITSAAFQRMLDSLSSALSWKKETNHTIKVAPSTSADTAGGNMSIAAGDGGATDANGGDLGLDAGAKAGSGTGGAVTIGGTNANVVNVGRSGKTTAVVGNETVAGTLGVTGAATLSSTLAVTGSVTATAGAGCGGAQDSKAILSCSSTTKGFLPPVMTTTQRNAISSPTEGLMVYNSTTHKLNVYTGSAWEAVTSA